MAHNKRAAGASLRPAPEGIERLAMEQFINGLDRSSDSKVTLCRITATYARNQWPLPARLSDWIVEVMGAAADGRSPFQRAGGKRMNYLDIVIFIRKLEKKRFSLDDAKKHAEIRFLASRQIINLALRKYDVDPDVLDQL